MSYQESLYAYAINASFVRRFALDFARIVFTALCFGVVLPMLNELLLCVYSWVQADEWPHINALISSIFLVAWAPIAFGLPALFTGLFFAVLLTCLKCRITVCIFTSAFAAIATILYMRQYSYVDEDVLYQLSVGMQNLSSINTGLLALISSVLACSALKKYFMPFISLQDRQLCKRQKLYVSQRVPGTCVKLKEEPSLCPA